MLEDSEDEGGLKGFNYGSGIHRDRNRRKRQVEEEEATDSEEEGGSARKAPGRVASKDDFVGGAYRSKVGSGASSGGDKRKRPCAAARVSAVRNSPLAPSLTRTEERWRRATQGPGAPALRLRAV